MARSRYNQKEVHYQGFNVVMPEFEFLDSHKIELLSFLRDNAEACNKTIRVVFFNYTNEKNFIGYSVYFSK